jgi:hypothetical protein
LLIPKNSIEKKRSKKLSKPQLIQGCGVFNRFGRQRRRKGTKKVFDI